MYSSLMGVFDIPPPTAKIDTISSSKEPLWKEFVPTHFSSDLRTLPSSVTTLDEGKVGGIESPMSVAKLRCESINNSTDDHPTPSGKELDGDVTLTWTLNSTSSLDHLDTFFPLEKAIFEAMMMVDQPLEDLHHRSYFCPPLHEVESRSSSLPTSDFCTIPLAPTSYLPKVIY